MDELSFSERLTRLWTAAGSPPNKAVVRRANERAKSGSRPLSEQRISDWRLGRRAPATFEVVLPVLTVLMDEARLKSDVRTVDPSLLEVRDWFRAWETARAVSVVKPVPDCGTETPPYRGLLPYRVSDAAEFFGRDRLRDKVIELIAEAEAGDQARLVLLLGAAGSGKTSLLDAGVRARLAERRSVRVQWDADLAESIPDALRSTDGEPVLLIIDQAEHLFATSVQETDRCRFIGELECLTSAPGPAADSPATVVMAFRSESLANIIRYPFLADALEHRTARLTPLSSTELRDVVTEPAGTRGVLVEQAVVDIVLRDVCAQAGDPESVVLPLLSAVLRALWDGKRGTTLTADSYHQAGGVGGVLAEIAEQFWADLPESEQVLARGLLLALVAPGSRSAGRNRLARDVLASEWAHPRVADGMIERLVAARLITSVDGYLELCHDALLTEWRRLAAWIEQERDDAASRNQVEMAAREWATHGRPSAMLYSRSRLRAVKSLVGPNITWNPTAQEFLDRAGARARAARRRQRRRVIVLVLAGLILGVVAVSALRLATYWAQPAFVPDTAETDETNSRSNCEDVAQPFRSEFAPGLPDAAAVPAAARH